MRYGSVCSGIEAATVAWHGLGWSAAWYSEIEPFPCAVLAHHYPDVPNHGDMTALPSRILAGEVEAPDLLCGGTPCQAFSVAGQRRSLDDARGNLSLTFCEVADAIDTVRLARGDAPAIIVWENVPGVLNTKDNAFGCFLAQLAGEDEALDVEKWPRAGVVDGRRRRVAWAVLDAQFFALAQRRRRVFVVAVAQETVRRLGDRADPAAILSLGTCLRGDTPSRSEAGQGSAAATASRTGSGGGAGLSFDVLAPAIVGSLDTECGGNKLTHQSIRNGHLMPCLPAWSVRADAMREGTAKTPSADAEGRVRLRDPGLGIYTEISPTLDTGAAHGVIATYDSRQHHNQQPSETTQLTTKNCSFVRGDTPLVCATGVTTHTLTAGYDASEDGTGRGTPIVPNVRAYGFQPRLARNGRGDMGEVASTLSAQAGGTGKGDSAPCVAVAYDDRNQAVSEDMHHTLRASSAEPRVSDAVLVSSMQASQSGVRLGETAGTLDANYGSRRHNGVLDADLQVRRLTPRECERLQGFPDDYTRIPLRGKTAEQCPDGPRYKAIGNSWAVPVVRWIGQRIADATNPQSPPTVGATA